ncbi:tectonic-1 [Mixophyes fleayi]|uniref:tectonic-1 n=1 Tax=Mixophyes fleayi TaxID=3061075 RepID=UPI003F4DA3E4
MSLVQRCLWLVFLCGTEAGRAAGPPGTEPPDTQPGAFLFYNDTDLPEMLGNETHEGTEGYPSRDHEHYTGQPPRIVTESVTPGLPPSDTTSRDHEHYTGQSPRIVTQSVTPGLPPSDTHSEAPEVIPILLGDPNSPELPQSRSISAFVTSVASLCVCDLLVAQCDGNCCCDPDCSASDFSVFSGCSIPVVIGDSQLCTQEAIHYSINASKVPQRITETVEVVNPNIFCIQATNYQPALSFITPDDPTATNFESLLKEFGGNQFSTENGAQNTVVSAAARNATRYEYGSPILTPDSYLKLPAPLGTRTCTDNNPVGFLESQDSTCSRSVQIENCSIPALTFGTYKNIQILPVPNSQQWINVTVQTVTIKSIDGVLTCGNLSDYIPSYDSNTGVCSNVVLGGRYFVTYTDQGEITSASVSLILGSINKNIFQQKFQVQFIEDGTTPAPLSGNPGYAFGLPLIAGFKLPQSGIIRNTNRLGQLTLLKSSSDQNCLAEEGNRAPVLFGYNMMSGCRLRINYTDAAFCQLAANTTLNALRGQQFPGYVAQFGNSQPENVLDWVAINTIDTETANIPNMCKIPVSLELEVKWTKFGSLVNPQAQIVNVTQKIAHAFIPTNLRSGRFVQILTSVTFLDVSQSAIPGYKAQPTIDAKLPFDFFYPFL